MTKMPIKIFSNFQGRRYSTILPNIDAIAEFDIAYPFFAYDVLLPVGEIEKKLNIFEEAVLKLTAVTSGNIKILSERLCLHGDFITFIQNKLMRLELVDKHYNITEHGKAHLSNDNEKVKVEYTPAKIFVDPNTGLKLPFINIGQFLTETLFISNNDYLSFTVGSEGNFKSISAAIVHILNSKTKTFLAPSEIENLVRKYSKLRKNNGRSRYYKSLRYAFTERPTISATPELIFLHLKLVIPNGDSDRIIISDGFSVDIDFLQGAIKANASIIDKFRKIGIRERDVDTNSPNEKKIKAKYKELFYHWNHKNGAEANYAKIRAESRNTADSRKNYYSQYIFLTRNIYGALEWCLFYALSAQPPLPETVEALRNASPQNNQHRLVEDAAKMGLKISPQKQRVFAINNLSIKNYENGTPELFTCLVLLLLSEGVNGEKFQNVVKEYNRFITNISTQDGGAETELHTFVNNTANLIDFLVELKQLRDSASHGETSDSVLPLSDLQDIYEFSARFISIILPDFQSSSDTVTNNLDASHERNKAIYFLEKELGFENFHDMPTKIRDTLINLESLRANFSVDLSGEYIVILAKMAEYTLLGAIRELNGCADIDGVGMKERAFSKLRACSGQNLNSTITNVKDQYIRQALRGKEATLGAYMIAYFAYSSEKTIAIVNQSCGGGFVQTVEKILDFRGHANKKNLNLEFAELELLRKDLIKIISSI